MAEGVQVTAADYIQKLEEFARTGDEAGADQLAREHLEAVLMSCSDDESWRIDILMRDVSVQSRLNAQERQVAAA